MSRRVTVSLLHLDAKHDITSAMVHSFRDVIALFGKAAALAEAAGVSDDVVRKWKQRDSIPAEYWPDVIKFASYLGYEITADHLMAVAGKRRRAA